MAEEIAEKKVRKEVRTSATHTPKAGMLVTCAGDEFRLTHFHDGRWWGANLGPKSEHHTSFLCRVPMPFIFKDDDEED